MAGRQQVLRLYKELLRESSNFKSYYYKNYFTRKIKSQFRQHLTADEEKSKELLQKSQRMLDMLKRQTLISNSYDESRLVIEDSPDPSNKEQLETKN